ncbi:MAG TPA: hypothetical protein VHY08_18060 [Bacillota bacterium]|nr:hypothetical protein [Bacillota bacterium]
MKKILLIAMMLVLTFSCLSIVKADILPPPTITLSVQVTGGGPLPTTTIYTAKISRMPAVWTNAPAMNFYCNGVRAGRALIDPKTLTAILKFTQNPGKYTAVAAVEDMPQPVKSDPVTYVVPPFN